MLDKEESKILEELKIDALDESEIGEALSVLECGMRDKPTHVAVFGDDPDLRQSRLRRMFGAAMDAMGLHRHMLAARRSDGSIVGVCGAMAPGECRPKLGKQFASRPTCSRSAREQPFARRAGWEPGRSKILKGVIGTSDQWRWTPICRAWA